MLQYIQYVARASHVCELASECKRGFSTRRQGKHCLLEAELSCIKDLLRREIYPIIIYIKICEKNIKKLR